MNEHVIDPASFEAHLRRISTIQIQVQKFFQSSIAFRIYKGRSSTTRPPNKTIANTLDISGLTHVLAVSHATKTCIVEPNVDMKSLLAATLAQGLAPAVVPEFNSITVGGAFAGTAGESSSFRHVCPMVGHNDEETLLTNFEGLFDETVTAVEVITADGKKLMASKHENSDLFEGMKGTFGTLGVATLLEIQLIDAKRFVEIEYVPISDGLPDAQSVILAAIRSEKPVIDFVDAIMFSYKEGVVMKARMIDDVITQDGSTAPRLQTFHKVTDDWFYKRAERRLGQSVRQGQPCYDILPLEDYLFRYDRGSFWAGKYAFDYVGFVPFNRITRQLLNPLFRTRTMYRGLHRSGMAEKYVIQDTAVPWNKCSDFFQWLDTRLTVYPLWLVPLQLSSYKPRLRPEQDALQENPENQFAISFGVWGPCRTVPLDDNRELEAKLKSVKGLKCMYARTYYTEEEFWSIYDREWYQHLREQYNANSLPSLYDKVGGKASENDMLSGLWAHWPLPLLRGMWAIVRRGDHLRRK